MTNALPTPDAAPPAAAPSPELVHTLAPRFWVPLGVVGLGGLCCAATPLSATWLWGGLVLALFGLFLGLQAAILRLDFTATSLQVRRGSQVIRTFPYADWLGWRLFWPALPVLFYFREQRSVHLLPMLFAAEDLRHQLEQRVPRSTTAAAR